MHSKFIYLHRCYLVVVLFINLFYYLSDDNRISHLAETPLPVLIIGLLKKETFHKHLCADQKSYLRIGKISSGPEVLSSSKGLLWWILNQVCKKLWMLPSLLASKVTIKVKAQINSLKTLQILWLFSCEIYLTQSVTLWLHSKSSLM